MTPHEEWWPEPDEPPAWLGVLGLAAAALSAGAVVGLAWLVVEIVKGVLL